MKKAFAVALFLTTVFAQAQGGKKLIRLEDAKVSDRSRFEDALRAHDTTPTQQSYGSKFAMVKTSGTVGDDLSLGITGIIHTVIPRGSLVGLRVRRSDNTTQVEGVATWDDDLLPGTGFIVKSPGGGLFFSSTKQYELVVVDSVTLVTTVDYIPVYSSVINGSPTLSFSANTGNSQLRIPLTSDASSANAVVVGGAVVPGGIFSTGPDGVAVDLIKLGVCFGSGDISVTVVRNGKSDTTSFRFPQGLPQNCGVPEPPKG
ncbi:MAG TPA: hypothetical protein VGO21_02070 [Candidatus Paceibacterota bacterium]|jgi:hypothetical protein|nr:hypothetical protein [Candidatus Paceibacterota bacterium]